MTKKVTMFVWNDFYNDSRVLRECTALEQAGYQVNLIALGKTDSTEERKEMFKIYRVSHRNFETSFMFKCLFICASIYLLMWNYRIAILFLAVYVLLKISKINIITRRIILLSKMLFLGLKLKTDIYHANDLNTLIQATICAKLKGKKLIFDSHEVNTSRSGYDSWIYAFLEKSLIHIPNCVIHENHTRAEYIENLYGFRPQVLYNYPYLRQDEKKINMHKLLDLPESELLLIYQGGLQQGRGLEQLIQAVPFINKGTVVFIGDGKLKEYLIQETHKNKLENRIKFIDKVPMELLHLYTRNAYIGFQLLNNTCYNHFSAASNKLFEYMMAGVPVVGCDFPEIKKIIDGEGTGIVVDSSDYISIANGVNLLVEDTQLWAQLKENSLKARMKYNWELEKVNLLKIYEALYKEEM
ncbi:glycosyltransferase [Enterococcus sp. DIV0660C]|uniref:glycosyltransferase n=1 Tax=Enterococcus sp. DIV0660C TaxID=2230880 RepID=UPI001A90A46B|nr:glycosyltransferase [Enterococcus sp. DIV0660C]MBO0432281.1 glycosyltransferase [Enterococcus sp. DIV0660C]